MKISETRKQEIENFAKMLSFAKKPSDLAEANLILGESAYGIRAMVSFRINDPDCGFPVIPTDRFVIKDYVVPYLSDNYVYVMQHDRLIRPGYVIDHTITLDSNLASHVNEIIRTKSLKGLPPDVMSAFDALLKQNINFDYMLYWLENIKQAYPIALKMRERGIISPIKFWKALKKGFRRNAVSLFLFRDIDSNHYARTGSLKFDNTYIRAFRETVDFCFEFYGSDEGNGIIKDIFLPLQRTMMILLLVILRVQFSSSEGPRKKTKKFLEIMQDEMVYFDRETIMAFRYFKKRSSISFLEIINPGGKQRDLLRKIDNLAWDMTWPRYAEWFITNAGQGDYLILFFLSFDRKLRELLKFYEVKAAIIDKDRRILIPVPKMNTYDYFKKEGFSDFSKYFSEDMKKGREPKAGRELQTLESSIRKRYRELRASLGWRK